ncbi:MAG: hypothetical protein D6709_04655 [Chloroflexi bacterium]|uniref:Uncharacterized protein n=1 Tax=Candidatus Thermofonsia Clade 3 bacterium TaxID=2364212 RepID=A0A2M8QAD1_9CHLR|nr:MAG: hypothetical protein CUN48_12085 [Candidatus Thermofonsia Clade 3 bacterium]RMG64779.1 MAG: hypothetical protein D6709_04655 [Chloroflexota bacterium]
MPPEAFNVPAPAPAASDAPAEPAVVTVGARAPAPLTAAHWRREYSEVLGDLRATALVFLALIAVMIVLSLIVR